MEIFAVTWEVSTSKMTITFYATSHANVTTLAVS
jgi:hypothetical protein